MPHKKYKQCGIYCYHNVVNGKNYVGQSVDLRERKRQFYNKKTPYSGKIFQNAIKKYGKDNFQFSILTHCKPEELNYYEQFYISRLKTTDRRYGYNSTSGGDSQFFRTKDCRENMRKGWTKERREEISKQQKGSGNHFFGRNHSEEIRAFIKKIMEERNRQNFFNKHGYSLAEFEERLKKYVEENTYATHVDIMKNFDVSKKTVVKMCKRIGYTSDKAIQKKRDEEKKVLVQCDRENHDIVLNYFCSISYGKKATGIKGINNCLNGSSSHSGGYFWRLLNENETPNYKLNEEYLKPTENAHRLDEKTKQRIRENGGWKHDSQKKQVFCYDSNGTLVKRYDSFVSTKEDGFNPCDVSNCCRGKVKTLYGYVFFYKEMTEEEIKKRFVNSHIKPIIQLSMTGEYVKEWNSATDASKSLGLSLTSINSCCHGKLKSSAGYKWMFKKDYVK